MPFQRVLEAAHAEQTRERAVGRRLGLEDERRHGAGDAAALADARRGGVEDLLRGQEARTLGGVGQQRRVAERCSPAAAAWPLRSSNIWR